MRGRKKESGEGEGRKKKCFLFSLPAPSPLPLTRPISSSLREVSTWRFREQIARSKKTRALQANSPQSAVHNDRIGQTFFPSRFAVVIAMFWKAKISFSLVKDIVSPRLQNMELVWTQKWRKIFYLKMNRNISRGSNMLTQLRSLGSVLKDVPQFFVQVSSFDDLTSFLKTLVDGPAGVWTHDIPLSRPVLFQLS